MKVSIVNTLVVDAKDLEDAKNLFKEVVRKNLVNRSNFNGGFIIDYYIDYIREE